MTLTELRYIVAVARERHFGRAAEACFVSQPTLSVAVKKLEDELGVALFERGKNEIRVTPIGERIIAQAETALRETEVIRQIAAAGKDQLSGPLRLGVIYTIGPYLLPHLIPLIRDEVAQMPLIIEENYTARLAERLRRGELDVILISLPFEEQGVVTLPLYDEPFVVVIPSAHPWRAQSFIQAEQLGSEQVLLLGPGHCFRDQVLAACPACARSLQADGSMQASLEGGSLETIRHMVATGMGITVLPCSAAGADKYSQRLISVRRFEAPPPRRRVALAWRKTFPRPKAIEALRRAILGSGLSCIEPV